MKLQSLFVDYILLPLISLLLAAILLLINKKNKLISNKKLIIFNLLFILLLGIPGILCLTEVSFMSAYYNIVQIVFLFIGYIYILKIDSFFLYQNIFHKKGMILLTTIIILCLGSYLFSLLFNSLGNLQYGLIASTCTYTILIPIFIQWTYQSMLLIPSEILKIWKYDENIREYDFFSDTNDKIIVLELELSKKISDKDFVKVKAKAPLKLPFGEWFQMFIHDHNIKYIESPIHFKHQEEAIDEWIFFTKSSFFKNRKHIDFEKTIEENQLTSDLTIVCKRINFIA